MKVFFLYDNTLVYGIWRRVPVQLHVGNNEFRSTYLRRWASVGRLDSGLCLELGMLGLGTGNGSPAWQAGCNHLGCSRGRRGEFF